MSGIMSRLWCDVKRSSRRSSLKLISGRTPHTSETYEAAIAARAEADAEAGELGEDGGVEGATALASLGRAIRLGGAGTELNGEAGGALEGGEASGRGQRGSGIRRRRM